MDDQDKAAVQELLSLAEGFIGLAGRNLGDGLASDVAMFIRDAQDRLAAAERRIKAPAEGQSQVAL